MTGKSQLKSASDSYSDIASFPKVRKDSAAANNLWAPQQYKPQISK